jgi:aspartate aminotransferase-like enzyme
MSPSAQRIQIDFSRFAGEEPASLYFDAFLKSGTQEWPPSLCRRFPALKAWQGISHLKTQLRRPVGAPPDWNVLLAGRSAQLMKLAAELLFGQCRNVLTSDLSWPSYRLILNRSCRKHGAQITTLSLRKQILRGQLDSGEVVDDVVRCFMRSKCDGLFLPAVDNLGIRVPVERIVQAIRQQATLRFVAVDGAQALCHVPIDLAANFCDFFIAGCHKWLGAYQPLGLAFYGHPRSRGYIERAAGRLQRSTVIDDPLMRFLTELQGCTLGRYGETVNLVPLFSCQGALQDAVSTPSSLALPTRVANADYLVGALASRGWRPVRPAADLRTGILLAKPEAKSSRNVCPESLRRLFHESGLAVSTYPKGLVRVSLPAKMWESTTLADVAGAFDRVFAMLNHSPSVSNTQQPAFQLVG